LSRFAAQSFTTLGISILVLVIDGVVATALGGDIF
jgi:hypothetical protein